MTTTTVRAGSLATADESPMATRSDDSTPTTYPSAAIP